MTIKMILRPTLLKVTLTIALFILVSWLWRAFVMTRISDTFPLGFPLAFFMAWGPCPPGKSCSESNLLYFVLDILFWYVISAFGIWLIQRKKS